MRGGCCPRWAAPGADTTSSDAATNATPTTACAATLRNTRPPIGTVEPPAVPAIRGLIINLILGFLVGSIGARREVARARAQVESPSARGGHHDVSARDRSHRVIADAVADVH